MEYKGGVDEHGNYRCYLCDGIVLALDSDMADDAFPLLENDGSIVHNMICSQCGAEYEIIQHVSDDD